MKFKDETMGILFNLIFDLIRSRHEQTTATAYKLYDEEINIAKKNFIAYVESKIEVKK